VIFEIACSYAVQSKADGLEALRLKNGFNYDFVKSEQLPLSGSFFIRILEDRGGGGSTLPQETGSRLRIKI
jgi:hypothetical protein